MFLRSAKRKRKRLLLGAVLLLLLLVVAVEWWVYPLVLAYGGNRAETLAVDAVTDTVAAVMRETQTVYGDLVTVTQNGDGAAMTLTADAAQLNLLQSAIIERLLVTFDEQTLGTFSVPLGTVFGGAFLSGRGSKIQFLVALDGIAKAALRDEFSAAGINQTYHRIYLDITLSVLLTTMGHRETRQVSTSVVMAQTVLMGNVPNTYVDWKP